MEAAAGAASMAGTSGGAGRDEKKASACDVEALRKCLEENKGDRAKCKAQIDAFRSSCSINPSSASSPASGRRPAA
ncbi:hypothetical protein BRADI_4g38685v3 [Brachypodium distachyon]|uniref:Uncharacterized protein n=1 Tax=Brachypodium distachyon TaxID=15368 RepID=A0A0Q3HDT2_BRADI|nr:hypothetical protein BRADI_4g38685v3 [Brachypodium distachyon]